MANWDQERTPLPGEADYQAPFSADDPAEYRKRFTDSGFRGDVVDDIDAARKMARTGGAATKEALQLQKESAAEQMALARGQDGGGVGSRLGSEAQAQSYVESIAPTAIISEAEKQGYSREEAGAAGLLAMSDAQFEQQIDQILGQQARSLAAQKQEQESGLIGTIGSIAGMISDKDAKENIRPVPSGASQEFLDALQTGKFNYRPEFGGAQDRVGPLLDPRVANTEIGQTIVDRDPATQKLRMNTAAAPLVNMALLKEQNERLRALEQAGGVTGAWYHTPKPRLGGGRHGVAPLAAPAMPEPKARLGGGMEREFMETMREYDDAAPYAMPQGARLGRQQVVPNYAQPARYGGKRKGVARGGGSFTPEDARMFNTLLKNDYKITEREKARRDKAWEDIGKVRSLAAPVGTPGRLAKLQELHKDLRKTEASQKKNPKSAVLAEFGGSSEAYDKWWNERPKKDRPRNWSEAMKILEGGK